MENVSLETFGKYVLNFTSPSGIIPESNLYTLTHTHAQGARRLQTHSLSALAVLTDFTVCLDQRERERAREREAVAMEDRLQTSPCSSLLCCRHLDGKALKKRWAQE